MINYINQFKYSFFKFLYLPLVSMIWILFNNLLKLDLGLDGYVFLLFINALSLIYYSIHFKNKIIINNNFNKIDYFFRVIPLMLFCLSMLYFYLYRKDIVSIARTFASFLILLPCMALLFNLMFQYSFGFIASIIYKSNIEYNMLLDVNLFLIKKEIKNSINGNYILVDNDNSGRSIDLVQGNKSLTYIFESKDFILDGIKIKLSELVSYQQLVGKNLFDMSDEETDVLKMISF